MVGQTLGSGFIKHGHEVKLGTRTLNSDEVIKWLAATPGATAGSFTEAAKFGELIVLAVKGTAAESAINLAGKDLFSGKTIMDATNPIAEAPPINGVLQFFTGPNESLAEKIQSWLPHAHVVKAFNSVGAGRMVNPHFEQGTPTMFYCGGNTTAKKQVSEIIQQLGWEPYDMGALNAARAIEPLCILWCIPGFAKNQWTHAFKLLTK